MSNQLKLISKLISLRVFVYSITFYYSFWIKERQSFLCLSIRSNTMLNRSKFSIGWSNVDGFFQHFAVLWQNSIATVLHCSFIEFSAAKHVPVSLFNITTIFFTTETQRFCTSELPLVKTRQSFFMFLVGITASSRGKNVGGIRSEVISAIFRT